MTRIAHGRLKVIPDGWAERHRPTAYGFLTGVCTAYTLGGIPDWPAPQVPEVVQIWDTAPCSVQFLTQSSRPVMVADGIEVIATHRVSVPIAAKWLHHGATIQVIDNPDDPHLNGREFQVLVAETGTTNWTREYLCQDINGQETEAA